MYNCWLCSLRSIGEVCPPRTSICSFLGLDDIAPQGTTPSHSQHLDLRQMIVRLHLSIWQFFQVRIRHDSKLLPPTWPTWPMETCTFCPIMGRSVVSCSCTCFSLGSLQTVKLATRTAVILHHPSVDENQIVTILYRKSRQQMLRSLNGAFEGLHPQLQGVGKIPFPLPNRKLKESVL